MSAPATRRSRCGRAMARRRERRLLRRPSDRDYAAIVSVAEKLPESVLQEDPKLILWYDQALTRMEGGA